jgi:hypothetical protein
MMQGPTNRHLAIYLNDHLAGAIAGSELAHRAQKNNAGTAYGPSLEQLAQEIDEDRRTLELFMSNLGIRKDLLKDAAAWMSEKVGRLKLNGQIAGYSPLSRVVELEGLALGINGKASLWHTLDKILGGDGISRDEIRKLIARASQQLKEVETMQESAAIEAFAHTSGDAKAPD